MLTLFDADLAWYLDATLDATVAIVIDLDDANAGMDPTAAPVFSDPRVPRRR